MSPLEKVGCNVQSVPAGGAHNLNLTSSPIPATQSKQIGKGNKGEVIRKYCTVKQTKSHKRPNER